MVPPSGAEQSPDLMICFSGTFRHSSSQVRRPQLARLGPFFLRAPRNEVLSCGLSKRAVLYQASAPHLVDPGLSFPRAGAVSIAKGSNCLPAHRALISSHARTNPADTPAKDHPGRNAIDPLVMTQRSRVSSRLHPRCHAEIKFYSVREDVLPG
jgi:hypothetical protein